MDSRRDLKISLVLKRTRCSSRRGMTLLEMTVVILVLMSLITILFIGTKAWKRGSDRAMCVLNIQIVQKGVRSYSNLYGLSPGGSAPNLRNQVIGLGRFVEKTPQCPSQGTYSYGQSSGANTIPPTGTLYLECSFSASSQHEPADYTTW
jgi:competence protein ComGC